MFTTNTSTCSDAHTYTIQREGCATLLKFAKELEEMARSSSTFWQDDDFLKKKTQYQQQYDSLHSLRNV